MIWFGYILNFYLLNFIFFVCYMLSYEITEWFKVTLLYSMTWINLVFTTIHFLLNIYLLIFFYIILLFVSHSLPKKVIGLSLSLLLILSCMYQKKKKKNSCNSILDWWFFFFFFLSLLLDDILWWCVFWVIYHMHSLSLL